jgi:hypothetical protein
MELWVDGVACWILFLAVGLLIDSFNLRALEDDPKTFYDWVGISSEMLCLEVLYCKFALDLLKPT